MKNLYRFLLAATLMSITGCGQGREGKANYENADTIAIVSSAASETLNQDERKFIRTSELKFKVKDVAKATYAIEDITNRQGGFVTYSNLNSEIDYSKVTQISSDSSLEMKEFTVLNEMTIRVPTTKLDTTLKEIAKLVDFLDYRIIKADDVSLEFLSNDLAQQRLKKGDKRISSAIENKSQKLGETTTAEESLLNKQMDADNAKVANLSLNDQINFSTIKLSLYQSKQVSKTLTANTENIHDFQPAFGYRIKESFLTGYNLLEDFIVFLVRLWGMIALIIILFVLYRKYGYKLKRNPEVAKN